MNIVMSDELRTLADEWAADLVDERRLHHETVGRFLAIVADKARGRWARLHAPDDPPMTHLERERERARRWRARKRAEAAQEAA